jgi:tRNA(Ile)-lysidine synthase
VAGGGVPLSGAVRIVESSPEPGSNRAGGPVSREEFATLMASVGVEPGAHVAVATSGGADSLALCLLVHEWVTEVGGSAIAFVVDHGMRRESGGEARQVRDWLSARTVEVRVLRHRGPVPTANRQAVARAIRYDLLTSSCRRLGIGDLLLGHHLDDQAETFLLRLGRGSGVDGLSAMPSRAVRDGVRILRPLLQVPRTRLQASLRARGQAWIDDPSNRDPSYARTKVRSLMPALAEIGLTAPRLAATAGRMARARVALEAETGALLEAAASVDGAGGATVRLEPLLRASPEIALRALSRLIMHVGGRTFPPRLVQLEAALSAMAHPGPSTRTLAGCRLRVNNGVLMACRELRGAETTIILPGERRLWDGRFTVRLGRRRGYDRATAFTVGSLGREDARVALNGRDPGVRGRQPDILPDVCAALPALRDDTGVAAVPNLGFRRDSRIPSFRAEFTPFQPLLTPPFSVVSTEAAPI